jgi:hypothetical protein
MYNFVFYFIYRYTLKIDRSEKSARYTSSMVVGIALFMVFALLYGIARFILCNYYDISIAGKTVHLTLRAKIILISSFAIAVFFIWLYFNPRRISAIVEKYTGHENFYTAINIIKFLAIIFLPLLVGIYFENKSVGHC